MASNKLLLMAAVAGIAMGAAQTPLHAQESESNDVKCFGVNSCKAHAGCSVGEGDVAAFKKLLGDKEFKQRYGKTRTHSCGAHASCGAAQKILNWTKVSSDQCKEQGGYVVDEQDGTKTARKL